MDKIFEMWIAGEDPAKQKRHKKPAIAKLFYALAICLAGVCVILVISGGIDGARVEPTPEVQPTQTPKVYIPVEDIIIEEDNFELTIGESKQIIARVYPENATYGNIIYSTNSNSATINDITVTQDGLVTATNRLDNNYKKTVKVFLTVKDKQTVIQKEIIITVRNPYKTIWDEDLSTLNEWPVYAAVFTTAIPNCSGFTFIFTLLPVSEDGKKDGTPYMTNMYYYVYVCTDAGKWIKIDTFLVGERYMSQTVTVSFEPVNIKKVACVPVKKDVGVYGYWNYTLIVKSIVVG